MYRSLADPIITAGKTSSSRCVCDSQPLTCYHNGTRHSLGFGRPLESNSDVRGGGRLGGILIYLVSNVWG
jgi:hypothetical protein